MKMTDFSGMLKEFTSEEYSWLFLITIRKEISLQKLNVLYDRANKYPKSRKAVIYFRKMLHARLGSKYASGFPVKFHKIYSKT